MLDTAGNTNFATSLAPTVLPVPPPPALRAAASTAAAEDNSTATLASRLNRSYQDIQEHLTHGAMELAPDDMTRQRLLAALDQEAGTVGESRNRKDPAFDSLEPPRDYAPKEANGPGTLSEDFGIKRKS